MIIQCVWALLEYNDLIYRNICNNNYQYSGKNGMWAGDGKQELIMLA